MVIDANAGKDWMSGKAIEASRGSRVLTSGYDWASTSLWSSQHRVERSRNRTDREVHPLEEEVAG